MNHKERFKIHLIDFPNKIVLTDSRKVIEDIQNQSFDHVKWIIPQLVAIFNDYEDRISDLEDKLNDRNRGNKYGTN